MKTKIHWLKSVSNEKGMALVIVLMVFVVISILGLSLIGMAETNLKISTGERSNQSSYYIAESGATYRLNDISTKLTQIYGTTDNLTDFFTQVDGAMELGKEKVYDDFEDNFGSKPVAKTTIERIPSDTLISYTNDYKITSKGTINNRTRTIVKIFHITWKPKSKVTIPANTVLFVNDNYTVKNYKITGSVGSNGTITLQGGQATISGSIYSNVGTQLNIPLFPMFTIPSSAVNYSETYLKMDSDKVFNTLTVNSGNTLVIDVGNSNRNLIVNNLNLLSNGKIQITGSGKLSIYLKNISMAGGNVINTDKNMDKLYMFLEGSGSTLNNGIIYGSMYANNTDLVVNNDSGVQGHIITNGTRIDINGAALTNTKMIYAPNAIVYINASISGSIICKTITSSGNDDKIKFVFVQINYDNSPLFLDNGSGQSPVKDMITTEPTREN